MLVLPFAEKQTMQTSSPKSPSVYAKPMTTFAFHLTQVNSPLISETMHFICLYRMCIYFNKRLTCIEFFTYY